jgi:hypothetical protein
MKMMRQRRPTVAKSGVPLVKQGALTYKLPLVGLYKLKGPTKSRASNVPSKKEQNKWKNIKGEEGFNKFQKENLCKRNI